MVNEPSVFEPLKVYCIFVVGASVLMNRMSLFVNKMASGLVVFLSFLKEKYQIVFL